MTQDYVRRLRLLVDENIPRLLALPEAATRTRPGPAKWCPREVLGRLIDSASNNHQRFVRAQSQDSLVFPGYDQGAWVTLEQYQLAPWAELVAPWRGFNLHLARVMATAPREVRLRPRPDSGRGRVGARGGIGQR